MQQGTAQQAAYTTSKDAVLSPMRSVASLEAASPAEGDFARLLESTAASAAAVSGAVQPCRGSCSVAPLSTQGHFVSLA